MSKLSRTTLCVLSQEGKERRQTGVKGGQRVGHREGQGQRCPLGAEAAGQRPVTRAVPGGVPQVGTRKRGAHQPAVPRGEGQHRCNWLSEETRCSQRGEGNISLCE